MIFQKRIFLSSQSTTRDHHMHNLPSKEMKSKRGGEQWIQSFCNFLLAQLARALICFLNYSDLNIEQLFRGTLNDSFTCSRFRYGDDDDSGEDEDDDAMAMQQRRVQSRQLSDGVNPMLQIFNTVSNLLLKSAANAAQRSGSQLIGSKHNEEFKGDSGADDDNDNVTGSSQGNYKARLFE